MKGITPPLLKGGQAAFTALVKLHLQASKGLHYSRESFSLIEDKFGSVNWIQGAQ